MMLSVCLMLLRQGHTSISAAVNVTGIDTQTAADQLTWTFCFVHKNTNDTGFTTGCRFRHMHGIQALG